MQIINHVQNVTIGSSGQYNIPNSTAHINGPPGTKLNNITILEILSDHPQRKYQVIKIPQVADIKTIRATYKNGILEIVFNKKEKPKLNNNKRREIKIE